MLLEPIALVRRYCFASTESVRWLWFSTACASVADSYYGALASLLFCFALASIGGRQSCHGFAFAPDLHDGWDSVLFILILVRRMVDLPVALGFWR